MANEAVLKHRKSAPIDMICADNTGFEKGTLFKLSGDRTVAPSASTDVFGGIAHREKIATDGRTRIATHQDGIWDLRAGGGTTISVGELVKLSGVNIIEGDVAEADIVAGKVVGKSLEAAAIGTAETIEVDIGVRN